MKKTCRPPWPALISLLASMKTAINLLTWSLVTWIVYAIYLHARHNRDWKGRNTAWMACWGSWWYFSPCLE